MAVSEFNESLENPVYSNIISQEREALHRITGDTFSSSIMPLVKLNTKITWLEYASGLSLSKSPIYILDLGAGDDCGAWTGGLKKDLISGNYILFNRRNPVVLNLQSQVNYRLVAHSAKSTFKEWILQNGVDEFYSGHYLDLLLRFIKEKRQFDLVLSRWTLYQSIASIQALSLIDQLLTPKGAAFLDTVSRGPGNNSIVIYRTREVPLGRLTRKDIDIRSLTFAQAKVGGLNWQRVPEEYSENAAWKKGDLDRKMLPQFFGGKKFAFEVATKIDMGVFVTHEV